jgi:hypothetical protein
LKKILSALPFNLDYRLYIIDIDWDLAIWVSGVWDIRFNRFTVMDMGKISFSYLAFNLGESTLYPSVVWPIYTLPTCGFKLDTLPT